MSQPVEMRLGHLVGYLRRQNLIAGDCAYKQENFIKTDMNHRFEGISDGKIVCSLPTLSRLENGKLQNSHALLDFFLRKLGIRYRIKESLLELENDLLNRIISGFDSLPVDILLKHVTELRELYALHTEDILFQINDKAVGFAEAAIVNEKLSRDVYDELMTKRDIFPRSLQDWLMDCGSWLKHSHPDFWDLKLQRGTEADKVYLYHQVFISYGKPENMMILKTLLPELHESSLVVMKLKEYETQIRTTNFNVDPGLEYQNCLMSAMDRDGIQNGSSDLFHALTQFNSVSNPQAKLDIFENQLLRLLSHEPYPKPISKALSRRIIMLCKRTKSYKPLSRLILLLSENTDENKGLSLDTP